MDIPVLRTDVCTVWYGQCKGSGDNHVWGTTGDFRTQEHLRSFWLEALELEKNKREKHVKEGTYLHEKWLRLVFSSGWVVLSQDSCRTVPRMQRTGLVPSHQSWAAQAHRLSLSQDFKSMFWQTKWQMLLQKYREEQKKTKLWLVCHTPAAEPFCG